MLQLRIISWVIWGKWLNSCREENTDLKLDLPGSSLICESAESRPKSRRHRETNCGSTVGWAAFEAVSCLFLFVCWKWTAAQRVNWRYLNEGLFGEVWVGLRRSWRGGEAPRNSLSRTLGLRAHGEALVPVHKESGSQEWEWGILGASHWLNPTGARGHGSSPPRLCDCPP